MDYSDAKYAKLDNAKLVLSGDAEPEQSSIVLQVQSEGERVDKWLAQQLPQFSRSRLQSWISLGSVLLNGTPVSQKFRLKGDEHIEVFPQPLEAQRAFVAEPVPLTICFEDENILVLDKAAGLVVHPGAGNWSGTLMNGLLYYHRAAHDLPRAGIVHRLDKDTSGLMVVAKTEAARQQLIANIAAREVTRRYFALAWGKAPGQFSVDRAIGRDPRNRQKMASFEQAGEHAKPARTDFRRVALGNSLVAEPTSQVGQQVCALECRLHSGRTHQIRVHANFAGFPLLGDPLYGSLSLEQSLSLKRQALHAWYLSFEHPVVASRGRLTFTSDLPGDLLNLVHKMGTSGEALYAFRDEPFSAPL